jgi:hypothetical protein
MSAEGEVNLCCLIFIFRLRSVDNLVWVRKVIWIGRLFRVERRIFRMLLLLIHLRVLSEVSKEPSNKPFLLFGSIFRGLATLNYFLLILSMRWRYDSYLTLRGGLYLLLCRKHGLLGESTPRPPPACTLRTVVFLCVPIFSRLCCILSTCLLNFFDELFLKHLSDLFRLLLEDFKRHLLLLIFHIVIGSL